MSCWVCVCVLAFFSFVDKKVVIWKTKNWNEKKMWVIRWTICSSASAGICDSVSLCIGPRWKKILWHNVWQIAGRLFTLHVWANGYETALFAIFNHSRVRSVDRQLLVARRTRAKMRLDEIQWNRKFIWFSDFILENRKYFVFACFISMTNSGIRSEMIFNDVAGWMNALLLLRATRCRPFSTFVSRQIVRKHISHHRRHRLTIIFAFHTRNDTQTIRTENKPETDRPIYHRPPGK